MKNDKLAITISLLIALASVNGETNEASIVFPDHVGLRNISPTVQKNVNNIQGFSKQLGYLTSIVTDSSTNLAVECDQIASALWLLGASRRTNSIPTLILNISFRDDSTGTYPATEAIVVIGEPAVTALLTFVCESTNNNQLSHAVQALSEIKGQDYAGFVEGQRSKLSNDNWKKLVRFAVRP